MDRALLHPADAKNAMVSIAPDVWLATTAPIRFGKGRFTDEKGDPNAKTCRLMENILERRNDPWFPSDQDAAKIACIDGGLPVGPIAQMRQRKAQGNGQDNGGVGEFDRTRR